MNQLIIVTLYTFDIVTFVVMQSIVQRQKLMLRTTSGDDADLPTKNETLQKTGPFYTYVNSVKLGYNELSGTIENCTL